MSNPSVVDLEHAKLLKECGWPQEEASYYWDKSDSVLYRSVDASAADIGCLAAPDAEMVLGKLPDHIQNPKDCRIDFDLIAAKETDGSWTVYYQKWDDGPFPNDNSLANAAAKMLHYLVTVLGYWFVDGELVPPRS